MKTLKIAAIALLTTTGIYAQDLEPNEVPGTITQKFKSMHTNASDVEWERENGLYKVDFEINRQDHEIWFTDAGEVSRTEQELKEQDLPQAIANTLKKSYSDYTYDDIKMIKEGNKISYEVEVEKSYEEKTLLIDENGNITDTYND